MSKKIELISITLLMLVTLGLRLWQLDGVPPGWRDDELINSLVISQHTLDGDIRPYYADASGHEGLYHILNAGFLALFGATPAGIRLLSVILGCITVYFTYLLTKELFDSHPFKEAAGLLAALALSFSFWSLMYSRTGIRHIALPALVLPCFYFLWHWLHQFKGRLVPTHLNRSFIVAVLCLGAAYYTYFASRGVPLILMALVAYIALVDWAFVRQSWKQWLIFAAISTLLAVPLYFSIRSQAGADDRIAELAVPLIAMREGDFGPLFEHVRLTLGMAHASGDGEFLYNIPDRPLFGPLVAILFWAGLAISVWHSLTPLWQRWVQKTAVRPLEKLPYPFLIFWWLAGISPAFVSVPPASLSHTILAQSAFYIIAVVPFLTLTSWLGQQTETGRWQDSPYRTPILAGLYGLIFVLPIALRDLPDYFVTWPQRGQVRFLYRADIHELATEVASDQLKSFAIGGPLAGPWDKIAFEAGLGNAADEIKARWYNPERATFLLPRISIFGRPRTIVPWRLDTFQQMGTGIGEFNAYRASLLPYPDDTEVCFENGLCVTPHLSEDSNDKQIEVIIQVFVRDADQIPAAALVSNPPPPDVYAGPRLAVFVHLLDAEGQLITGDDGLWVDPDTLEAGDIFQQRHLLRPSVVTGDETLMFGLYDPKTGKRILTADGRDAVQIVPSAPETADES